MPPVKVFLQREVEAAVAYGNTIGIAVHLHRVVFSDSSLCFRKDVEKGLPIAHVFHCDRDELYRLGRKLGVRRMFIDRLGERGQHLDLCGGPLRKLLQSIGRDISEFEEKPCQQEPTSPPACTVAPSGSSETR